MNDENPSLPMYLSHKRVWALKIASLDYTTREDGAINGGLIYPADDGYGPVEFDADYFKRCNPAPGGYYVVYEDGYKSYSPAKAFEDGYSRMGEPA